MTPRLFRPSPGSCWICGSLASPTREHKFKASDIRRIFGLKPVYVHREGSERGKLAPGPRAKALKYKSTICKTCNNTVTQEADYAYDLLVEDLQCRPTANDEEINTAIENFLLTHPEKYRNLFRYFSKLLGCHLAEDEYPIPRRLTDFVGRKSDEVCIWLTSKFDFTYQEKVTETPAWDGSYAAHGGLVIMTAKPEYIPTRYHSTLTVGHLQFIYDFLFNEEEVEEMKKLHVEFLRTCKDAALRSESDATLAHKISRLGITGLPDGARE